MASLTLEQLTAVCDEIAALSRAGLPLDRGLKDASSELPTSVAKLTAELSRRLEAGEPLETLILSHQESFPPAYRAVLAAGVRAGDLPGAVEAVSRSARTLAELRHNIRVAWIYPYFLLVTAYVALWVMLQSLPTLWEFFRLIELPMLRWEAAVEWLASRQQYWYPALGVLLVLWIARDWRRTTAQSELFDRRFDVRLLGSGWQAGRRLSQQAAFCELLALLLEHDVPLAAALQLAAEGSDPTGSSKRIEETCRRLEQGNTEAIEQSPLPPMMKCVLLTGGPREMLAQRLRRLAGYFRRDAEAKVSWAAMRLPLIVALLVGGTVLIAFAATFWLPWLRVLQRMLEPNFR
jgi:general secretion pathway protein F